MTSTSFVLAVTASVVQATPEPSAAGGDLPKIAFEKYTLPNGLDVILHEDHSTPIVGVNLWYHVGSKNELPGRTGFAHLFEHMMFQGSQHYDRDYFLPLQQAGGKINGSTSQDRTNYWETVPSNFLELALWMESDRMAFLLPAMTQERLDNQRSVVKNERRQSYENRPYGLAYETILAALFPAGPSVQLADDRLDGRLGRRLARGRGQLLPPLLPSRQRQPVHRGRFRAGRGQAAGGQVLRPDSGRPQGRAS